MAQQLSRASYDRLKDELEQLKGQRQGIVQEIKEAREQGDLRENFAYHDAKDRQGLLEARISSLELRLENAEIVDASDADGEVVMGSTVTILDKASKKERQYTIVTEEEHDQVERPATAESPVGQALLGQKAGDVVEVQGPNGVIAFEILKVEL